MSPKKITSLKKAIKVNYILVLIFNLLIGSQMMGLSLGSQMATAFLNLIGPSLIITIIYFIKVDNNRLYLKAYSIILIPLLNFFYTQYQGDVHLIVVFMLLIYFVMVTLYYNKTLSIIHTVIFNLGLISIYIINPHGFHLLAPTPLVFTILITIINTITLLMFFQVSWGSKLIVEAETQTQLTNDSLAKTTQLNQALLETANTLNIESAYMDDAFTDLNTSNDKLVHIVTEANVGLKDSASHITDLWHASSTTKNIVEINLADIRQVSKANREIHKHITDCIHEINDMSNSIVTTKDSVRTATETVHALNASIKAITGSLDRIKDIASQSNLLALNASIEAARAGVHGKGFSIVAEEIRNLAEESDQIASDIGDILEKINSHGLASKEKISLGERAIQDSQVTAKAIASKFNHILEKASHNTEISEKGFESMQELVGKYDIIYKDIESMTSIIEELSASTSEIDKTTLYNNERIKDLSLKSNKIKSLSQTLQQ
ncbi:hypothetical protein EZV73_07580 [Acidaminobacter sp. JC074]|uniref:methyl-accepting chemotaxis protein n=1 Tax=Acidaminobacter sp. JC074 TaxID=2530199 RepID=UPI001F10FF12|nr:methyl-accepting chemotaxis protein [Acidaminobacter sp. JC074]MCH4887426.1 hypothetical protein [Acidaminobacter sp. JC074]